MSTTSLPPGFPSEPDLAEAKHHAGVFLDLVTAAVTQGPGAVRDLMMDYLDPDGVPFTTELHSRYLAAVGPLVTATYMNRRDAPVSPTWSRITAHPAAATRPERCAVRAIAAHRAGDDDTSRAAQVALFEAGGHEALLEMVLVVLRICAEVKRPS